MLYPAELRTHERFRNNLPRQAQLKTSHLRGFVLLPKPPRSVAPEAALGNVRLPKGTGKSRPEKFAALLTPQEKQPPEAESGKRIGARLGNKVGDDQTFKGRHDRSWKPRDAIDIDRAAEHERGQRG